VQDIQIFRRGAAVPGCDDPAVADDEDLPLPDFVHWSIFPFVGEFRVRPIEPPREADAPRDGEPGGAPCRACAAPDDDYIWVDDHWRVSAPIQPSGAPVQVFLETRDHVDLDDLGADRVAELGPMIVRLNEAILAVGGIGRVHINRWGDGGSHFHVFFYGRPLGDVQMFGFTSAMWAMTRPPTPDDEWTRNLAVVAAELARQSGRAIV
jgi:hypothetical protein